MEAPCQIVEAAGLSAAGELERSHLVHDHHIGVLCIPAESALPERKALRRERKTAPPGVRAPDEWQAPPPEGPALASR